MFFNTDVLSQKSISIEKQKKELNKIYKKYSTLSKKFRERSPYDLCSERRLNYKRRYWLKENAYNLLNQKFNSLKDKYILWGDVHFLYAFTNSQQDYNQWYQRQNNLKSMLPHFEKAFSLGLKNEDLIMKFISSIERTGPSFCSPAEYYLHTVKLGHTSKGNINLPEEDEFWEHILFVCKEYVTCKNGSWFMGYYWSEKLRSAMNSKDLKKVELYLKELEGIKYCGNQYTSYLLENAYTFLRDNQGNTYFPINIISGSFNDAYDKLKDTLNSIPSSEFDRFKQIMQGKQFRIDRDKSAVSSELLAHIPHPVDDLDQLPRQYISINFKNTFDIRLYQHNCKYIESKNISKNMQSLKVFSHQLMLLNMLIDGIIMNATILLWIK